MAELTVGVIGTSWKENERRVPIHPAHLDRVPVELRSRLFFERGYGRSFGCADGRLGEFSGGLLSREELIERCALVLLPKPVQADFDAFREGQILWGWPHCVQQAGFTQTAIEKRMTLLAFEAMFHWTSGGVRDLHTFYKNNELAGYCAVLDALRLRGWDGFYGPRKRVAVLSFGSVSRGAVHALQGRGFTDITIYTRRPSHLVRDQLFGVRYQQISAAPDGRVLAISADGAAWPLVDELARADVIVNGILQDTDNPLMFIQPGEEQRIGRGTLIIDVSCDRGMGFSFAEPTSFASPTRDVSGAMYYAVDHTPTYLWDAASWEISEALVPYLPVVMGGPSAWERVETVRRCIEVRDGVIQNPKILSFQQREAEYPHAVRE